MIGVEEARQRLFSAAARLAAEDVALDAAAGRVLAAPVAARRSQPPFPASAMDGYAARAGDLATGGLAIVGESAAGRGHAGALRAGEAVRIFTGAPVPEGADTVLIQEDATIEGGRLFATGPVAAGAHIRAAALDFGEGETVLGSGMRLAPRHVALAAAAGHAKLSVARRPRVAFLATGDELVLPGEPAGPDSIVASTAPALAAMVREAGGDSVDLGIAPDKRAVIAARAREGMADADVLVTLGGASVGDHDLVAPALADLGIALDFWKVAVRPGKPLMFAAHPLVLGLPGNPVSAVVCTILFLVPLVEAMQGIAAPGPHPRRGVLGAAMPANGPRRDHARAFWRDDRLVPFAVQDSSMLSVLARADALIVREPHAPAAAPGNACDFIAL